jgi:hypothetical protein
MVLTLHKITYLKEFISKKYKIICVWTEQGDVFWLIKTPKYIKCVPKYGMYNPCVEKEKENNRERENLGRQV